MDYDCDVTRSCKTWAKDEVFSNHYDVTYLCKTWAMDKVFSNDYDVIPSSGSWCHNLIDMYLLAVHVMIFPIWQTMYRKTGDNYIKSYLSYIIHWLDINLNWKKKIWKKS